MSCRIIDKNYFSSTGDEGALQTLRERLSSQGKVLEYGSEEWNNRMKAYSRQGNQIPSYIIECGSEADVVEAVRFSRSLNLPFTTRNGAHNLAELSNIHGGVVISQSPRTKILEVNTNENFIRFEGGCKFSDVDAYLWTHTPGWAMQSAMISSIGITGSHTALGVGWLQRLLGNGIDNLLSVRIVLSDGTVTQASNDENSDLFWAIQGAGHNFGVITEITEKIHQVIDPQQGKEIRVGCFLFDLANGETVWEAITAMNDDPDFPDEGFILPLFLIAEGKPSLAVWLWQLRFKEGLIQEQVTVWEEKMRALVCLTSAVPLSANGLLPSAGDGWENITYLESQALFNPPWVCTFYPTGGFVSKTKEKDVFLKVLNHWRDRKQPDGAQDATFHTTAFYHFGGRVQRIRKSTAWPGNSETNWLCATWGGVLVAQNADDREKRIQQTKVWVDTLHREVAPDMQFGYICAAAYNWKSVNYARWIHGPSFNHLVTVKTKYDPSNVVRQNINIPTEKEFIIE